MKRDCTLHLPQSLYAELMQHLFPGDGDEHAAVIAAGLSRTLSGYRLLARDVFLAEPGKDYGIGKRGHRALSAQFIHPRITMCRDKRLIYLAVHNHGGTNSVGFSDVDYASHERGYPALLDIARGMPVGALVFAQNAVEGDIWFPGGARSALRHAVVLGQSMHYLWPAPPRFQSVELGALYHRQVMMFGKVGQARLARAKVGIIGLGGIGSLVNEYLARLGVGHLLLIDPDRISDSNFSRVAGATVNDLNAKARKVDIAERLARQANPQVVVHAIAADLAQNEVALRLVDCDYLFLAADTMRARLVFNALVQQYYVPGVQLGAKVRADEPSGDLLTAYSVTRLVRPEQGCLLCNQLINPTKLADEWKTDAERRDQHYGTNAPNPSVITLNAVSASNAVNDFLFDFLGLRNPSTAQAIYHRYDHLAGTHERVQPRRDASCLECGSEGNSRLGMGDVLRLPCT